MEEEETEEPELVEREIEEAPEGISDADFEQLCDLVYVLAD